MINNFRYIIFGLERRGVARLWRGVGNGLRLVAVSVVEIVEMLAVSAIGIVPFQLKIFVR